MAFHLKNVLQALIDEFVLETKTKKLVPIRAYTSRDGGVMKFHLVCVSP